MTAQLVPFPQSSLANIPTKLRELADAYEKHPEVKSHLVVIALEDGKPVEAFGLGAGTDAGLSLAMVIRARSVLTQLLLDNAGDC